MKPWRPPRLSPDPVATPGRLGLYRSRGESGTGLDRPKVRSKLTAEADTQATTSGTGRFFDGAEDPQSGILFGQQFPEEHHATLRVARALRSRRFDLLGYRGLFFGDPVDWRFDPLCGTRSELEHWSLLEPSDAGALGDVRLVWELNRHQWLVQLALAYRVTGDEGHAEAAVSLLRGWMWANPPGLGVNWASSLEVSLRLISWCWALPWLEASPLAAETLHEIVPQWLALHANHVKRYTSRATLPNTHQMGEALGLFYAGVVFPGIPGSNEWLQLGAQVLNTEIERQVSSDGVHFAQSTCYQRYAADIYLHFLVLAERNGLPVSTAVRERLQLALDFLLTVCAPDGRLPRIGENDGGSLLPLVERGPEDVRGTLAVAAACFARPDYAWAAGGATPEVLWLFGRDGLAAFNALVPAPPARWPSRVFVAGGYAVMRSGWERDAHQLILDVGPLSSPTGASHEHADLLSVLCAAHGEPCIADPGTYCGATDPQWRDALRGTVLHSTVVVNGQSQLEPAGPGAWRKRPEAKLRRWLSDATLDYADAEHRAYERLPLPVRHRRRVLFVKPRCFVLADDLEGPGVHRLELRFQLDALSTSRCDPRWIAAHAASGAGLVLGAFAGGSALEPGVVAGDGERIEGWISPNYGVRRPAPAVVFSVVSRLPVGFVTVIVPCRLADTARLTLPLVAEREGGTGFRIVYGQDEVLVDHDTIRVRTPQAVYELD